MQRASVRIQRILAFTHEYQDIGIQSPVWQNLGSIISAAYAALGAESLHILPDASCNDFDVFADPMFGMVFYNLIDNSLKHGGNVSEIRIQCIINTQDLVIIYEDNGAGVPDAVRPTLFEPGTGKSHGYGLFLIREILAITGFKITETGKTGSGARFEILVPDGSFRKAELKDNPVESVSMGRG
jgi:signal transduction histidine kinase